MVDVWIVPANQLAFPKVLMRDCREGLGLKPGPGLQLASLPAVWARSSGVLLSGERDGRRRSKQGRWGAQLGGQLLSGSK